MVEPTVAMPVLVIRSALENPESITLSVMLEVLYRLGFVQQKHHHLLMKTALLLVNNTVITIGKNRSGFITCRY